MRSAARAGAGFTLVELLVAIAILGLLGVMSYRGLSASIQTQQQLIAQNDRWRALSRFYLRFEEDVWESTGRPVRSAAGPVLAGFAAKPGWGAADDAQLLLARPDASLLAGVSAATVRIGYRHAGDRIERLLWPAAGIPPRVQVVLPGVRTMRLRYLAEYGGWRDQWPHAMEVSARPQGIELLITLDSGETLTRFFSLI